MSNSQLSAVQPISRDASAPVRRSKLSRILENWPILVLVSLFWVVAMIFISIFADFLAPTTINATDLLNRLHPPIFMGGTIDHILGTDEVGRDMLSRL